MLDPEVLFPFPLDQFQLESIEAINSGNSIVLTAPTGSGKTLIGEFAIYRALSHQSRLFYTTPLKALSNQKFRDFSTQFGSDKVGLLTGDISINRDAPVLVMTTEIFRNMLYGEFDDSEDPLLNLEAVVLDECHYMNDPQRGTVWEETIIHCPSRTQLIALSATIANPDQLTKWINFVHGPTELISSEKRPVPLDFVFCSAKGLHPLLNDKGNGIHPNCKVWRSPKGQHRKNKSGKIQQPKSPSIAFVISNLAERNMLPAIYFIFSRKGCERAIDNIKDLSLVNYHEANLIQKRLDEYTKNNPEAIKDNLHFEALKRGIASHHAGLLPAWRELIEDLFIRGLIKVVFATETLAAGINMPARTTVISSLSKRSEEGHRLLFSSEFLQMSGRAGRRGKDNKGFVVAVQNRFEGAKEASLLATSKPNPLISQFTPSYGMVLNLLQNYDIDKSKELIKRSFGSFIYLEESTEENFNLSVLQKELNNLKAITNNIEWKDFESYEKLTARLKEERRLLRILEKQASIKLSEEIANALKFLDNGSFLSIKAPQINRKIIPAIICKKIYNISNKLTHIVCLTLDNLYITIKPNHVVNIFPDIQGLNINELVEPDIKFLGEVFHGNNSSRIIANKIVDISKIYDLRSPQYDLASEVVSQIKVIRKFEKEIQNHPAHNFGDFRKLKKSRKKILEIEKEIEDRDRVLKLKENYNWQKFTDLIKILNHFACLSDLNLTEIGNSIISLRTENNLWVGLVLLSGYLDDLDGPDIAAIIQAIAVDYRRQDLWCNYLPSSKVKDTFLELEVLKKLINSQQKKYAIDCPIYLEKELTGLVSEWSKGRKWREIVFNTSLDEGDIVRLFRRTIDLLSQVQYCIGVSEKLKKKIKLVLKSINRFPISESHDLSTMNQREQSNPATERVDNLN